MSELLWPDPAPSSVPGLRPPVRLVVDNVLPPHLFEDLSTFAMATEHGERDVPNFESSSVWNHLRPNILKELGPRELAAAFIVKTTPTCSGSAPHLDHGQDTALLHCNDKWDLAWGGDFFFVNEDRQTIENAVEFRPNRLVLWDRCQMHMHRPPTAAAARDRFALVMRFSDGL